MPIRPPRRKPSDANAVAVILARAGSKGVPGKNRSLVGGRPCIEWTIDAAVTAARVGAVIVSTDDPAIARLARAFGPGVIVVERPAALASDTATVDAAARHAVKHAPVGVSIVPDTPIVILYANVPIRPPGLIDRAVDLLTRTGADSVQSYAQVGKFHPWWTAKVNPRTGRVAPWQGRVLNHGIYRRQDLPPAFIPDGGVLVVREAALNLRVRGAGRGPHAFFGRDRRGLTNPEGTVIDIDTPTDLIIANTLLSTQPH